MPCCMVFRSHLKALSKVRSTNSLRPSCAAGCRRLVVWSNKSTIRSLSTKACARHRDCMCACVRSRVCLYAYVHVHAHAHAHVHVRVHVHVHVRERDSVCVRVMCCL